MIIPIWKKIGQSSHLLAKKTGEELAKISGNELDKKATHTGTLDPMAEGVLVVLTGDDRFNKQELSNWDKTYEFELMLGVSTDTLDLLGLQTKLINMNIDLDEIGNKIDQILKSFLGQQVQTQPRFSAQRVSGKSAFDLAKNQVKFIANKNKINIKSLEIISSKFIDLEKIHLYLQKNIAKVVGDFRQEQILQQWQATISKLQNDQIFSLPIIKIRAQVTKKTYIRSLCRDISKALNLPGIAFSITRTENGPYSRESCATPTNLQN
jgi:tRNA pseudouridine(55) synthase